MNQVLAHDRRSPGSARLLHRALRAVVVLSWVIVLAAVLIRPVPKALALDAFVLFRVCAVCVGALVVAEVAFLRRRSKPRTLLLDAVLALSMFAFWFFVRAATY